MKCLSYWKGIEKRYSWIPWISSRNVGHYVGKLNKGESRVSKNSSWNADHTEGELNERESWISGISSQKRTILSRNWKKESWKSEIIFSLFLRAYSNWFSVFFFLRATLYLWKYIFIAYSSKTIVSRDKRLWTDGRPGIGIRFNFSFSLFKWS